MRLKKVQDILKHNCLDYRYSEEDGCGSIDFLFRGISYHIWEFADGAMWGAETNLRNSSRPEDLEGDYEEQIAAILLEWPGMECPE